MGFKCQPFHFLSAGGYIVCLIADCVRSVWLSWDLNPPTSALVFQRSSAGIPMQMSSFLLNVIFLEVALPRLILWKPNLTFLWAIPFRATHMVRLLCLQATLYYCLGIVAEACICTIHRCSQKHILGFSGVALNVVVFQCIQWCPNLRMSRGPGYSVTPLSVFQEKLP